MGELASHPTVPPLVEAMPGLAELAKVPSGQRARLAQLIDLALEQSPRLWVPQRYAPRHSIDELEDLTSVLSVFDAALTGLDERTVAWFNLEAKSSRHHSLAQIQNILDKLSMTLQRCFVTLSSMQAVVVDLEKRERLPTPSELMVMMLYEAAVRSGGKLSVNKNSTREGNPGSLPKYLKVLKPYVSSRVVLPQSLGTLDRLKRKADRIISTRQTLIA